MPAALELGTVTQRQNTTSGLSGGSCRSTRSAGPLEKADSLVPVSRASQGLRVDS